MLSKDPETEPGYEMASRIAGRMGKSLPQPIKVPDDINLGK